MPTRTITEIPVDQIRAQILERDVSSKGINELTASIKKLGVIEPLIVAKAKVGYILQAGKRRLTAARAAGLLTVPCIVLELDQEKGFAITIHENLYRQDLNPTDEALIYQQLRDKHGYSSREIAHMVGQSEGYISQRLQIILWPDNLTDALKKELISFSVARELSAIGDTKHRNYCLRWAIEQGANYRTVRNWRIAHESSIPANSGSTDYSQPPEEHIQTPVVQMPCYWCDTWHDPDKVITIHLCTECFGALKMSKDNLKS
jgi:ParB family chromosome partitioning protein